MKHYFNTQTGELLNDVDHGGAVENAIAQSATIVEVVGLALDIVKAGSEKVGGPDGPLPEVGSVFPRPDAEESPAEAQKNLEAEEKAIAEEKARNAQASQAVAAEEGNQPIDGAGGDRFDRESVKTTPADNDLSEDEENNELQGEALDERAAELEIKGRSSMSADEKRAAIAEAEAE